MKAACECQTCKRHRALIEEAVEAARLYPEAERLHEEERRLLALRKRTEKRLAVLAA